MESNTLKPPHAYQKCITLSACLSEKHEVLEETDQ